MTAADDQINVIHRCMCQWRPREWTRRLAKVAGRHQWHQCDLDLGHGEPCECKCGETLMSSWVRPYEGRLLGGYRFWLYDTALGTIAPGMNAGTVKVVGDRECVHHLTSEEARAAAAALRQVADDAEQEVERS